MITTTSNSFTPSVNIVRDLDKELTYISTPNAQEVFNTITNDFITGVRSFNIIGAYGTGKSSFIWAFDKVINGKKDYFPINPTFQKDYQGFESVNLIGSYSSLTGAFAGEFGLNSDFTATDIIKAIDKRYKKQKRKKKGLIIFIDEFGKFLEYAAKHEPEQELYFVQQLAEYVNDVDKDIFLITTLHQDFNSYSKKLTQSQKNEWSKVQGRLKEVVFNEPVEQLLYLASERLADYPDKPKKDRNFERLFKAIKTSKAFPLRDYLNEEIAENILPLDILAASLLTLALQKYGQNERSLFSFIESNDHLGLNESAKKKSYYNIALVHDYLLHNFSVLTTKNNPHYAQWAAIRNATERTEGFLEEDVEGATRMVKTIGLLNIFASASARLDEEFLTKYGKLSLNIKDTKAVLKELEKHKIIRYVRHSRKFILFEGTDLDIELAIDEAGNLVEKVTSVVNYLERYFEFPHLLAKANYYEKGTPRFFSFKISETPLVSDKKNRKNIPLGEIDGFINLVFSEDTSAEELQVISRGEQEAIIYGLYTKTQEIRNLIFEIEKVQKVIEYNTHDKVAIRELKKIKEHQVKLLNHYVLGAIYSDNQAIQWFFQGKEIQFKNQREFNRILSDVSNTIYHATPTYKSELLNKTKLSPPIMTARKYLIRALVENWEKEHLGFVESTFPPEKTIYLSLLHETGILKRDDEGNAVLGKPHAASFTKLWDACEAFVQSSTSGKRSVQKLNDMLLESPFKLKKGFVDFWMPIFLFIKRDDYALFEKDIYVPYVNDQILEIVAKSPHKFYIKAFDVEGVGLSLFLRYRRFLEQSDKAPSNNSFIETIRPFLTFYKALPDYTKRTQNLTIQALNLREAIAKSRNPEDTFIQDFPKALNYSLAKLEKDEAVLDEYIENLQAAVKEIRTAFDNLMTRFEKHISEFLGLEELEFVSYHTALQKRFKKLKSHRLLPHQKVFLNRVKSELDRNSWLNSVAQACVGKTLNKISDSEELLLNERFVELVHELDNLLSIADVKGEHEDDKVFSVQIQDSRTEKSKSFVRLPKAKMNKVKSQKKKISGILSKERDVNIAALTDLLKELLNE